ncbi:MAG: hypothetical protein ACJ748_12940 [Flavisolibacter sp.]
MTRAAFTSLLLNELQTLNILKSENISESDYEEMFSNLEILIRSGVNNMTDFELQSDSILQEAENNLRDLIYQIRDNYTHFNFTGTRLTWKDILGNFCPRFPFC